MFVSLGVMMALVILVVDKIWQGEIDEKAGLACIGARVFILLGPEADQSTTMAAGPDAALTNIFRIGPARLLVKDTL